MPSLCLYFKVHQPYQLKPYTAADVCVNHLYEDKTADQLSINQMADECYLPANSLIESLIYRYNGRFKVSFSISGIVLELFRQYRPDVISSFKDLVNTGCVELLAETYYHSFSFLYSKQEFERQVLLHTHTIKNIFEVEPKIFRNTELVYNNRLAEQVSALGYTGILCEGVDYILKGRSPNKVFKAPGENGLPLLIRNVAMSDDISFRFDNPYWNEHPLTAEKFTGWIASHPPETEVINLFMDYETFGVHKNAQTGIFHFLGALPENLLRTTEYTFNTPSGVIAGVQSSDIYNVQQTISWENKAEHDLVWNTNVMQNNTLRKVYSIGNKVMNSGDEQVTDIWGRLQCADYFYYMAHNHAGNFGKRYLNPFQTPEEVFGYYSNILTDFEINLINRALEKTRKQYMTSTAIIY